MGFPCGSAGKESTCNAGDPGLNPGSGRSSGEGKGYPLQYLGLENSMECIVHGGAKSRTPPSDFHFTFTQRSSLPCPSFFSSAFFQKKKKETNFKYSEYFVRILPLVQLWLIYNLSGFEWRRKWQPTPVFLPGESHGWRSLVGYSPRGRKESDTTERLN